MWEVEANIYEYLISALDDGEWLNSFYFRKRLILHK
jgi:hypothetical protein